MNDKLAHICQRLKSEILAELKLLTDFSGYIEKMKSNIKDKNWIELEKKITEMHRIADKVENLEKIRNSSFTIIKQELHLDEDATIHRVLPELDYAMQQELADLHRELKLKVLKVKIEYQNLGYYVRNLSGFIYKFLEEVFPHTKGKIYSRQGKAMQKTPESIMIDKNL